jgi:hypothetical protein
MRDGKLHINKKIHSDLVWNVVVERLELLLCIRDVPGSILDAELGYSDIGFHGISQSLQANAGLVS